MNIVVLQQFGRSAGILTKNDINRLQHFMDRSVMSFKFPSGVGTR